MIFSILQKISLVPSYIWDAIWAPVYKKCMKHCGKGVFLRPMSSDIKGLWNLSVGDGTSIPKGSTIYCTDAPCTIGKKVIFGPRPTIITGDHRIDVIGKHLIDVMLLLVVALLLLQELWLLNLVNHTLLLAVFLRNY